MRITLEITAGPDAGRKVWLSEQQSIVVGRTDLAELPLPNDAQLSSLHFEVAWKAGAFQLRDLKSTNGTKLNGKRVTEATLHDGDLIAAGKTKFLVAIDQREAIPLPPPVPPAAVNPLTAGLAASAATDTKVGSRTEPKMRESLTLPAVSETHGTLVFDTPVRLPAETAGPADSNAAAEEPFDRDPAAWPVLVIHNKTRYSVACLPWQNAEGAGRLTVVVKATFRFAEGETSLAETQLPIEFADQHEEDNPMFPARLEADTAPFKPRTDVVLVGTAYAPGGRPRATVDVRLRVGAVQKRLRVFGDRRWLFPTRLAVVPQVTDPIPFQQMPLTYRRAFGGIDEPAGRYCPDNLAGVGFIGEPAPASVHNKPLPNIEDPEHLIAAWDSRPQPAGFGFYGRSWQPRLKFAGTYDDAYYRARAPRPPEDFAYDLYQGAHPDLQVAGYLDGDELVELENVTKDGYVKFTLPGIRPRITVTRYTPGTPTAGSTPATKVERPVKPFLDAVVFLPDDRVFYEVFRAVFALRDIDQPDIAEIRVE